MRFRAIHHACVVVALTTLPGCNKAEFTDMVDQVKQKATDQSEKLRDSMAKKVGDATDQVQESLQLAGRIELTVDQPVQTSACFVGFHSLGAEQGSVLQIRSYRASDQESFPSVFFQARVAAESLEALRGQTVQGKLFVQAKDNGPVWSCPLDETVAVTVTSLAENRLQAEVVQGQLLNSDQGTLLPVTGKFLDAPLP